jgi:hypothetical protein
MPGTDSVLRRGRHLRRVGIGAAAMTIAAAIALGLIDGTPAASSPVSRTVASPVATVVTIDSNYGVTLGPPGSSTPAMTADAAWSAYASTSGFDETTVPPRLSVSIGSLTDPIQDIGPTSSWTYRAFNELVYAYSMNTACLSLGAPPDDQAGGTSGSGPVSGQCVEWTFLDANTGDHVITDYAPVSAADGEGSG